MNRRSNSFFFTRLATAIAVIALGSCGGSGSSGGGQLAAGTEVGVAMDLGTDQFAFPNFGAAASVEQFDASDVVAMFGDGNEVCASGTGESCQLTAEAATWARMVNQARQSGHCEGFAVMAAARFTQALTPKTAELPNTGDVTHGLMRGFATQFLRQVQDDADTWAQKSVAEKVAAIDAALKAQKLEYALGVYSDIGGHAVLPWKITYTDATHARIHVYDSNWPGVDRYVTADVKNNSWTFSFSGQDPENDPKIWSGKSGDMDMASMSSRESGGCPFCEGDARVKSSMFVIRSAALDWQVTTSDGTLTPKVSRVGNDLARPLKAAEQQQGPLDYLLNVRETLPVKFDLPSRTHLTGLTADAAVEITTTGNSPSTVELTDTSVTSDDPGTVLTLASGNLVATANGASTELNATPQGIEVVVQTTTGQSINVVVDDKAPAVEVRTPGASEASPTTGYQILTQTNVNEITIKTVTETGKVTEKVVTGTLSSTSADVEIAAELEVASVDPSLPPAEARDVIIESTTTTTSTTSTSTTTTTTPRSTTTTSTTTTTTIPPTTTTIPPITPWGRHFSGGSNEQYQQIITDSSGNLISIGYFCGDMTIGSFNLNNIGVNGSTCDTFIEKISPSGVVQWITTIGGTGQDFARAVAVDNAGNVYFTMSMETNFVFAGQTMSNGGVSGGVPMYGKLNSAGVPQWGATVASSIAGWSDIAAGSEIYFAVTLTGPSGVASIGGTSVTTQSSSDVIIAQINPANGAAQFVRSISGGGGQSLGDIATDASGNAYVMGTFTGTSAFIGVGIPSQVTISNSTSPNEEGFTARFNANGAVAYAKVWGGEGPDYSGYLAITSSGRVYQSFRTTSNTIKYAGTTLVRPSGSDIIGWVEADGLGVIQSSKLLAVNYYAQLGGFDVDDSGNVYLAGTFNTYSLTFGSITLNNSSASDDIFYLKVSSSGNVVFADSGGGSGTEYMQGGGGVTIDPNGNPFVAFDSWSPTITIGSGTFTNVALDGYLVRSNPAGDLP